MDRLKRIRSRLQRPILVALLLVITLLIMTSMIPAQHLPGIMSGLAPGIALAGSCDGSSPGPSSEQDTAFSNACSISGASNVLTSQGIYETGHTHGDVFASPFFSYSTTGDEDW